MVGWLAAVVVVGAAPYRTTSSCLVWFVVCVAESRSGVYFTSLFKQAGLTIIAKERQQHFPHELFPVTMYALA